MLTLVSRTMRPDLSDAALSRHFADVAEMAGGEQNWRMAEAFIALAYMSAEIRYDDLPVLEEAA